MEVNVNSPANFQLRRIVHRNRINGVISVCIGLMTCLIFCMLIFKLKIGNRINIDFSTDTAVVTILRAIFGCLLMLNHFFYYVITGIRRFRGLQSKFRLMYFFSLLISFLFLFVFVGQWINSIQYSITWDKVIAIIYFSLLLYNLIVDTIYQFRRKSNNGEWEKELPVDVLY